jgi:hypothetical protein
VRKPLIIGQSDTVKLVETYLFDAKHKAELNPNPDFSNQCEISIPAESVMLMVVQP